MSKKLKINIFKYKDYREFLKDWYDFKKENLPQFSFRYFSNKAGFKTSNFMMLVMNGKRNLTEDSLKKFLVGLGLNKQESDFFKNLVFYNQAKDHDTKDFYYQKLIRSQKYKKLAPIEKSKYKYYSNWYHPVIREIICSPDFDGRFEWIAARINPKITVGQVEQSIKLLEELKFIEKVGPGKWKQKGTVLSTGPELTSLMVHNYHKVILELTRQMLDHLPAKERDVSTMTLGIKKHHFSELKTKIADFRKEILSMVADEDEPDEVVQVNFQLFPVTVQNKKNDGREK